METIKVVLTVDDSQSVNVYIEKLDGARILIQSFEFPYWYEYGYKWGYRLAGFLGVDYTELDLRAEK